MNCCSYHLPFEQRAELTQARDERNQAERPRRAIAPIVIRDRSTSPN